MLDSMDLSVRLVMLDSLAMMVKSAKLDLSDLCDAVNTQERLESIEAMLDCMPAMLGYTLAMLANKSVRLDCTLATWANT